MAYGDLTLEDRAIAIRVYKNREGSETVVGRTQHSPIVAWSNWINIDMRHTWAGNGSLKKYSKAAA